MIEGMPPGVWIGIAGTGWALVALFVTLVWRGKLVPLSTHNRELEAAAVAVENIDHDRSEWRAESRIKDTQIAEKDRQLGHLAEVGETQKSVLSAVQRLTEGGRR